MEIVISTVPTVALMLILRKCLIDRGSKLDRVLSVYLFSCDAPWGLASGWVGSSAILAFITTAMYTFIRGRVPWKLIAICAATVLFLEVGKNEFAISIGTERGCRLS